MSSHRFWPSLGGVVAILRIRSDVAHTEAETDSIITRAARRAVGISQIAIDQLETELADARQRIHALETELADQRRRRHELEDELADERKARRALAARVGALESWIRDNTSHDPEAIG